MELFREIIRDVVGVIFPGGFLLFFFFWFLFGASTIFVYTCNIDLLAFNGFITLSLLIIFSYIAGQSLRLKQLDGIEETCTKAYRKKRIIKNKKLKNEDKFISNEELERFQKDLSNNAIDISKMEVYQGLFNKSVKELDFLEQKFYYDDRVRDEYLELIRRHFRRFGLWEEFPYPMYMKDRRLQRQTSKYNNFFLLTWPQIV